MEMQNLDKLVQFRHDIHQHPELGFCEHETSRKVQAYLDDLGVEYVSGIGKTGIVAWIKGNTEGSDRTVGLRADMDALPLEETSGVDYSSKNKGCMHACGHDGHTTMLLGAVEHFHNNRDFAGTIYFVFQPAEEGVGGGKAMVDDGLFDRFPMDEIYGLHNWPGLPVGKFGLIPGPLMASGDRIDVTIHGKGGHGGLNPHGCIDPVRIAADFINRAHTIISREVDPLSPAVLSICAIQSGDISGFAVIPDTARMSGTLRSLDKDTRKVMVDALERLARSLEAYYGCTIELNIEDKFEVTYNEEAATDSATKVIRETFGAEALASNHKPTMGGEDFSYMLAACPGAYIHLGAGDEEHTHGLHNPGYDFNDKAIPYGVELLAGLALESLGKQNRRS